MDLDDGERYAAAALFTLALHTTQVEVGVDEAGNLLQNFKAAWGCPDEELFDDLICVPENEPWPGMEVPNGFWGFDCCAPQGLCRRVYSALSIAETRWPGLLKMPDVSDAANSHDAQVALVGLVRRYCELLDPAVAPLIIETGSLPALQHTESPSLDSHPPEQQSVPQAELQQLSQRHEELQQEIGSRSSPGAQQQPHQGIEKGLEEDEEPGQQNIGLVGDGGSMSSQEEGFAREEGETVCGGDDFLSGNGNGSLQVACTSAEGECWEGRLEETSSMGSGCSGGQTGKEEEDANDFEVERYSWEEEDEEEEGSGPSRVAATVAWRSNPLAAGNDKAEVEEEEARKGEKQPQQSLAVSSVVARIHTSSSPSPRLGDRSSKDSGGVRGPHQKARSDGSDSGRRRMETKAVRPGDWAGGSTNSSGTEDNTYSMGGAQLYISKTVLRHDEKKSRNAYDDDKDNNVGSQSLTDGSGPMSASSSAYGGSSVRHHSPTHRSVLAIYELIGACLRAAAAADMAEVTVEATALCGKDGSGGGGAPCSSRASGSSGAGGSGFFSSKFWGGGGRRSPVGGSTVEVPVIGTTAEVAAASAVVRVVRKPLVRWYDARARVALRRLCDWLHIPAPKMHAMEAMWALQLLQPRLADGEMDGFDSAAAIAAAAARGAGAGRGSARYATYLKIGAGALGGAALLALTGGIAAPAIAAGLGSAIMVLHGSAAAATVVTTLGTSTAGTAAITGTFGVIGASHAGSKTADLYGDLREFGFWSISAPLVLPPPPCSTSDPTERADTGTLDGASTQPGSGPFTGAGEAAASPLGGKAPSSGTGWEALLWWRSRASQRDDEQGVQGTQDMQEHPQQQPQQLPTKAYPSLEKQTLEPPPPSPPPRLTTTTPTRAEEKVVAAPPMPSTPPPPPPPSSSSPAVLSSTPASPGPSMLRANRTDPKLSQEGLFVPLQLLEATRELEEGGEDDGSAACVRSRAVSCGGVGAAVGTSGGRVMDPNWLTPADLFRSQETSPFSRLTAPDTVPEGEDEERGETAPEVARVLGPVGGKEGALGGSGAVDSGVVPNDSVESGDEVASWTSKDSDPWDAEEMEAAESNAVRVRASIGGVDGAFLAALMAAYDAEAADLDGASAPLAAGAALSASSSSGGGGGSATKATGGISRRSGGGAAMTTARGNDKDESSNRCSSSPAAAAAGGKGTVWRWFRSSSKEAVSSGSDSGRGAGGAAGSAAGGIESGVGKSGCKGGLTADTEGRHQRPLLPVPIHPRRSGEATLALTIAVNGWVKESDDFLVPWRPLPSAGRELWALVWESDVLRSLGGALRKFIRDKAIEESGKMVVRLGVSTALVTAMMLPMAVMSAINITIGSRWRVVLRRAQLAGRHLAHMLMQGAHGDRPVTLIGFSMGARLIFHCLLELSRCGARGLVERAVLLGTPVSANPARWMAARSAVSGRLVNAFSSNDWVLGVIFRAHSRGALVSAAAGVCPVAVVGVENTNLSALIAGHTQYLEKLEEVLSALNLAEQ